MGPDTMHSMYASGDNVEAHWSGYFLPQHDIPEDLDPEE